MLLRQGQKVEQLLLTPEVHGSSPIKNGFIMVINKALGFHSDSNFEKDVILWEGWSKNSVLRIFDFKLPLALLWLKRLQFPINIRHVAKLPHLMTKRLLHLYRS